MVVNVYASSIAKTVFMVITLMILMIAWFYSIVGVRLLANRSAINNIPVVGTAAVQGIENGIKAIPVVGTGLSIGIEVMKYTGIVAFAITMAFLVIFESCWRPQRHLKKCRGKVTELIDLTEFERIKNKYKL